MRIRSEQLRDHLSQGLAVLYVVCGDEPLLSQEAAASIRAAARERGYSEHECLTVDTGFDWNRLLQISVSLSLFGTRRLLELRLGSAKPGDAGSKILRAYAEQPPADAILLVRCGKLDLAAQKSQWFKALDATGVIVSVRAVEARQLPAWIEQRMLASGLRPKADAIALLAERVEGNLLAAAQEIDKLQMLFGDGELTVEQLSAAVNDNARYSVYDLVDAALAEKTGRTVRVLNGLRSESVDAILICWVLHREIRLLAILAFRLQQGQRLEVALNNSGVWERRKPLLRRALQRLPTQECRWLLRSCARLDRVIKGVEPGDPWDELLKLSLNLAGRPLLTEPEIAN